MLSRSAAAAAVAASQHLAPACQHPARHSAPRPASWNGCPRRRSAQSEARRTATDVDVDDVDSVALKTNGRPDDTATYVAYMCLVFSRAAVTTTTTRRRRRSTNVYEFAVRFCCESSLLLP